MGKHTDQIIQAYREGKVKQSTIVKMAAFKEELEKVGESNGPIDPGMWERMDEYARNVIHPSEQMKKDVATLNERINPEGLLSKVKGSLGKVGLTLLMGTALGVGGLAAAKGIGWIGEKWENHKKEPMFAEMLNQHPELLAEDQEKVKRYYDALWHFSPHVAKNPMAAGAYIRAALPYESAIGGPTIAMVKDLTEVQKNIGEAHKNAPKTYADVITNPMFMSNDKMVVEPEMMFGKNQ